MADFEVRLASGATLVPWIDPEHNEPTTGKVFPSRVRPHPGNPQLYWQVKVGATVEFRCSVAGVEAPLDAALGGRLFTGYVVESPGAPTYTTPAPAQSSVQQFTPSLPGHYAIRIRRPSGGAVIVHFDAVP